MRLRNVSIVAAVLFLVLSCGISKEDLTKRIEKQLTDEYLNTEFLVDHVTLVKKSDHQYDGIVEFVGGGSRSIEVTVDQDSYIYKYK